MRIRRAHALTVTFDKNRALIHNFLLHKHFYANGLAVDLLSRLGEWTELDQVGREFARFELNSVTEQLAFLLDNAAILIEKSPEDAFDQRYATQWEWGAVAGFYHFGMRFTEHIDSVDGKAWLQKHRADKPSPPLLLRHGKERIDLPEFDQQRFAEPTFSVMFRRRSRRRFSPQPMPLVALADCLFAGAGVTDVFTAETYGVLPMTMTPSGGARNPFDLYVMVHHVQGLDAGIYHYDGLQHSLMWLKKKAVAVEDMMGKQRWPAKTAALVMLVANFQRSMWKYAHPQAYKVILMEAGFISQNILLAATAHGLCASPSGAMHLPVAENQFDLDPITQAPVMIVGMGMAPPASDADRQTTQ